MFKGPENAFHMIATFLGNVEFGNRQAVKADNGIKALNICIRWATENSIS